MKITKQRIKEIIREEKELASSKPDLKAKMKELSDALADDKFKIEPAEAEEVDRLITRILAAASAEKISTTDLRKANEYIAKYLNVDTLEEDVLEERRSRELRQGLNELSGWFSKWVFSKGQQKDQEQRFINKYENSVYRKLKTEEDKAIYIKKRDEKIAIAKNYLALKAAEQKAQTPEDKAKIEQAEDNVDQKATQLEQEAEAPAEPDTSAGAEPSTQPEINTEILKDLVIKFANMLKDNNLLAEAIGDIVKLFNITDTKKFGDLLGKTFTREEIKMIDGIFQSDLKDTFINLVKKAATKKAEPADEPAAEEPKADEKGVVKLTSGDKAIPSQFDELVDVFKRFSDDDKGFMMKTYLVEQDKLLGELRSALRRFIGLEVQERAINEQEEPQPQVKPEDKTKGSRESLVKYVSRYRRDINNTSKVMGEYLAAAQAGTYKAQPILNKLKIQLQRLQDDNAFIIRDLKALAGLKESLLLEEESRKEKIANVRKAYDEIVDLLRPLLNVNTATPEEENKTEKPPAEEPAQDQQNEELVLEDIYLEQVRPSEEEMQTYVNAVNDALTAIDSIKGYFRLTGTFNRPLEEVKDDFVKYIQDYKETMSDLVSDLKSGIPTPEKADQYVKDFARLAKQIQDDFGVSPREPIKTPEITVNPEGAEDNTAAIADNSEAQKAAEVEPELEDDFMDLVKSYIQKGKDWIKSQFTEPETPLNDNQRKALERAAKETGVPIPDRKEPEADIGPRPDDITDTKVLANFLFDNNSDYFSPSVMDRIFGREYADAFKGIRRLLLTLLYSKTLQNRDEFPIADETLQEETDRQKLTRIGTQYGYDTAVISKFLNSIKGRNYLSKGTGGRQEITSYNDLLNAITTLEDTKLKQIFSTLEQAEDDLKNAGVAFSVSSSEIKQKIQTLLSLKGSKGKFAESKENKNLLERLIKKELKVLNGKKMVRN